MARARRAARRLLIVVTHPMTADLLMRGQLAFLRERGWSVGVAASPGPELEAVARREGCDVFPIRMSRRISPLADLPSLMRLLRVIREFSPDIVSSSTPKAGLLGTVAAWLARVPRRVYVVRGLRLETTRGAKRLALLAAERIAATLATDVVCVSPSLRARYVELGLAAPERLEVLGAGSSNGVDVERFRPAECPSDLLPFEPGTPVIGFVGRLTRDKGVEDLLAAFDRVRGEVPAARLLLVGDFEEGDPVPGAVLESARADTAICITGFVADTSPYYRCMSVLAFPSAREGFPNAPLEAAASGIAVAGYRVTGTCDAVSDGSTGTLVDAGDVGELAKALLRYLRSPQLAAEHGERGRKRAVAEYRRELVWERWERRYREMLA